MYCVPWEFLCYKLHTAKKTTNISKQQAQTGNNHWDYLNDTKSVSIHNRNFFSIVHWN